MYIYDKIFKSQSSPRSRGDDAVTLFVNTTLF